MKRRVRKIANFFAFNLLFFALYLNFIHKDKVASVVDQSVQTSTAAFSGTILVDNPENFIEKKTQATAVKAEQPATEKTGQNTTALKLTIN